MVAIVENESRARVRFEMLQRMVRPCGPPTKDPLSLDD